MYRKLIFIVLTMLQFKIEIKFALLLFISSISLFSMYKNKPFISRKFNILEITSNISSSIVLLCGAIYVNDAGAFMEIIGFLIISFFNGFFFFYWLFFAIKTFWSFINARKLIKNWYYLIVHIFKPEKKNKKREMKVRLAFERKQKKIWE